MKRVIGGTLGLVLGVPAVLMVRPLLYYAALKGLRKAAPEMFDSALALAAVLAALREDGYV